MFQYEVRIFEIVEHVTIVNCDNQDMAEKKAKALIENGFYGDDFLTVHTQEYSDVKIDKVG